MEDNGLDMMPLTNRTLLRAYLDDVDVTVSSAVLQGDPDIALQWAQAMRQEMQIRGVALAKLLYKLREQWALFEAAGLNEPFEKVVCDNLGLTLQTVRKYTSMWEMVERYLLPADLPQKTKDEVLGKGARVLTLLTPTIRDAEGDVDWEQIARASSKHDLRQLMPGERTSSSTRRTILLFRDGTLKVKRGGGNYAKAFGMLNLESDDPDIQDAIDYMIRTLDIQELV
jgi:hypothetical protein